MTNSSSMAYAIPLFYLSQTKYPLHLLGRVPYHHGRESKHEYRHLAQVPKTTLKDHGKKQH